MSTPATLSWEGLHELFTVVMCIDKSMKIVYASDTLGEKMPETLRGPLLSDVFSCLRPVPLETFSQGVRAAGSLCLLVAKSEKFAIRGQLLKIEYEGRHFMFLRIPLALLDQRPGVCAPIRTE